MKAVQLQKKVSKEHWEEIDKLLGAAPEIGINYRLGMVPRPKRRQY